MKLFGIDFFPQKIREQEIVNAIIAAEEGTTGEIRVHISHAWLEKNLMTAAQVQFQKLKMQETQERNGVILYFNLPKHQFAIFGDSGIHEKVTQAFWDELAAKVSEQIKKEDLSAGLALAVQKIGAALKVHFPVINDQKNTNELGNEISKS